MAIVRTVFLFALSIGLAFAADTMTLVKDGKACFRIVTNDEKGRFNAVGPADFALFTKEATGASVKVVPISKLSEEKDDLINIHIGFKSYGDKYNLDYPKPAGFRVVFPDNRTVIIAGVPYEGIEFNTNDGVMWFLEKYLGIRFLFPGEVGTHVPTHEGDWIVPIEDKEIVPSFFSRQIPGVHGQSYTNKEKYQQNAAFLFAMRAGITASVSLKLNHNVGNLLDPDKYAESHPEFFPLIDGKRRIPPKLENNGSWRVINWEPCYTAPGIEKVAAENVIKFFEEHPDLYSCSLSVNDSDNICRCENCMRLNAGLPNGSESQSYYEWVKKVVDIVNEKYPDRMYGMLNYWVTKEMPRNVKLQKNVVPIVCEDLNFYADPALMAKLEARLAEWDKIASTIGWWDYGFEGDYIIPSYKPHYLAKMLKYLYSKHNLRSFFEESQPSRYYKNAPEVYMLMKLLYDIDADPDVLLDEWFETAVGAEAAVYMKRYFDVWERVWTEKIPHTDWFKDRAAIGAPFLQRRESAYLDAVDMDDVTEALENLEKCVTLAPAGKPKQRAEFYFRHFAKVADRCLVPYINMKHLEKDNAVATAPGKVLRKYDFSKDEDGWIPWQLDKHTAILRHNAEFGHDAPGCLESNLADSLPTGMTYYMRPIGFKMEPGKSYRISVWCRGMNISNDTQIARMIFFFPQKEGAVIGRETNGKGALTVMSEVKGEALKSGEWHKLCLYVSVPKTAWNDITGVDCQLEYETYDKNSGVLFDDFTIEEISLDGWEPYPEFGKVPVASNDNDMFTDEETGEKLGPELIVDGDMEAPDTSAWNDSYTPKVKEKSSEFAHSGKQSMHIVSDGAGDGMLQIIKPTVLKEVFYLPQKGLKIGSTYRVQAWVKNAKSDEYNDIRLAGTSLKHPMITEDGEWHLIRHYVKYEQEIATDYLTIGYGTDKSDVYVDDVSIREVIGK